MSNVSYTAEEIVRRGTELYEREVRPQIERDHFGQFVVMDVVTGRFEIAGDHLTAAKRARERFPGAPLFAVRVGFPAAARIGGRAVARGR